MKVAEAIAILIVFASSLIPLIVSLLILRKARRRWEERLGRIRLLGIMPLGNNAGQRIGSFCVSGDGVTELDTIPTTQPIGNPNCIYNAHSLYLRCAVNPEGPCEGCPHLRSAN